MITVCNHRSMFDDPSVVACLLPFWVNIKPDIMRWGLCAQEYCYNPKLPAIIKAYIGAGKILPIKRGDGIDQKLLLDFTRKLANGDWCHLFPEAGKDSIFKPTIDLQKDRPVFFFSLMFSTVGNQACGSEKRWAVERTARSTRWEN